jgi:hypothetical protein
MRKSQTRLYGGFIALLVLLNAGTIRAQTNDTSPSESHVASDTIASSGEITTWCATLANPWYRDGQPAEKYGEVRNDVTEKPAIIGMMVAEDMRCRQCHGKCDADNLRCRSQCLGDSACLVHCEERSSKCTAMCKQLFQCQ